VPVPPCTARTIVAGARRKSIQEAALRAAGCDVIRAEKQSGTSTQGRAELRAVLDFISKGDVLMSLAFIASRARSAICKTSSARSKQKARA
jgi:hypothetical protein